MVHRCRCQFAFRFPHYTRCPDTAGNNPGHSKRLQDDKRRRNRRESRGIVPGASVQRNATFTLGRRSRRARHWCWRWSGSWGWCGARTRCGTGLVNHFIIAGIRTAWFAGIPNMLQASTRHTRLGHSYQGLVAIARRVERALDSPRRTTIATAAFPLDCRWGMRLILVELSIA